MTLKYQLRYAAGIYWLLQMEQSGETDLPPIMLNECGAYIWNLYQEGKQFDQISAHVSEKYEIKQKAAAADVTEFFDTLQQQGIMIQMEQD
jgi:hypothetical protein